MWLGIRQRPPPVASSANLRFAVPYAPHMISRTRERAAPLTSSFGCEPPCAVLRAANGASHGSNVGNGRITAHSDTDLGGNGRDLHRCRYVRCALGCCAVFMCDSRL